LCVVQKRLAHLQECPKYHEPRYIKRGQYKSPAKVLQHFPLIPRLQQLFKSLVIVDMMNWTAINKSTNGKMKHIGDSPHWKWIDEQWPEFAMEKQNVRVGLSLNGMNPFEYKNNVYFCWPVTILKYNLPPWQTIKKFFIIMVLLIPRPESALDKNIDVWLAPIQEELKQLWEVGVETSDAHHKEMFTMKAILILTIADYAAHNMIKSPKAIWDVLDVDQMLIAQGQGL
jgi:hypothetical protein